MMVILLKPHLNDVPCMFRCTKINQGCFDFICHSMKADVHHFTFFQCTVSLKHKYKMVYVNKFLQQCFPDALNSTTVTRSQGPMVSTVPIKVHFYVVTPYKNMLSFNVGSSDVENLDSVRIYDPTFGLGNIKITGLKI
jgi:hypothetical protein